MTPHRLIATSDGSRRPWRDRNCGRLNRNLYYLYEIRVWSEKFCGAQGPL